MVQTEHLPPQDKPAHDILLKNRTLLSVTGVQEVTAYDSYAVTLLTDCGVLVISGENLKVLRFSTDNRDAEISGKIEYLQYRDFKKLSGLRQLLHKEKT